MKKILPFLTAMTIMAATLFPIMSFAQSGPPETLKDSCTMTKTIGNTGECPPPNAGSNSVCDYNSTTYACGQCCMLNAISVITDWIFYILIIIAGIMIIIAAFIFVTSSGRPEATSTARNMILYAAIGLLVALLAKAIPAFVRSIVT